MIEFGVMTLIILCVLGIVRFKPVETELENAIPLIKSAHLRTLEQLLKDAFDNPGPGGEMATILTGFRKLGYNAVLFHRVARSELRKIGNKPPEAYDSYDLRVVEFAQRAINCRLMLILAIIHIKMLIAINPVWWPLRRWAFAFCKNQVIEEYRHLVIVALQLCDSYGDYLHDALLSAL